MKTVTVSKEKLLKALRENKEIHIKEVEELQAAYQIALTKELQRLTKLAKAGSLKSNPHISLDQPMSYEKEYNDIIGMLEFSEDTLYELDMREYKQYILNEWNWSSSFAMSKAAYGL